MGVDKARAVYGEWRINETILFMINASTMICYVRGKFTPLHVAIASCLRYRTRRSEETAMLVPFKRKRRAILGR